MVHRPTNSREWPRTVRTNTLARWLAIGGCLSAITVLGAGCIVTPRQPASQPAPPVPQVPENAPGSAQVHPGSATGGKSDFHEQATDAQRFHVHLDFGRVFESQGNYDAAALEYQDALTVVETTRRGPFRPADEALAHRRIGGAFDRMGRFAQAEVHYKKALKLSPKDPKVWNDAGYSYYLQGRWADAERTLATAAKLAPEDERIKVNLGLTLAAAGRPDEALPLLSLSNGDAIGHANLGYLLASTGQFDLARRQYETAVAKRPDLELARRAIVRLDRQQHDLTQAERSPELMATQTRSSTPLVDPSLRQTSTTHTTIPAPRRTTNFAPTAPAPPAAPTPPPAVHETSSQPMTSNNRTGSTTPTITAIPQRRTPTPTAPQSGRPVPSTATAAVSTPQRTPAPSASQIPRPRPATTNVASTVNRQTLSPSASAIPRPRPASPPASAAAQQPSPARSATALARPRATTPIGNAAATQRQTPTSSVSSTPRPASSTTPVSSTTRAATPAPPVS
jgi:Flp pilus assembly protein TadD